MISDGQKLLKDVLGEGTAVFLAGFDRAGAQLTLHIPAGHDVTEIRARARRAIPDEQIRISVQSHRLRDLAFPRSIEHWLRRFDIEDVIHDPTMIVARARSLVQAAQSCRAKFGQAISSILFEPDSRTLFVQVGKGQALNELRAPVAAVLADVWRGPTAATLDWRPSLQVVSDLPSRKMVAIDAMSGSVRRIFRRAIRRWRLPGAIAMTLSALTLPAAAHTDSPLSGRDMSRAPVNSAVAIGEFGVLSGLSVFTDGQVPRNAGAFASSGLDFYFAEGSQGVSSRLLQLAEVKKKRRRRDPTETSRIPSRDPAETGQVGGGPAGGTGPGS
jgi:hypothetical protein